MTTDPRLGSLLDTLIPGDGKFPAPSAIGISERLAAHTRFGATVAPILARLTDDFARLHPRERADAVAVLEGSDEARFAALQLALYSLYYTDETVLACLASVSGYSPRAPQPAGCELEPFDPASVAVPAARPPHYRRPEGPSDE